MTAQRFTHTVDHPATNGKPLITLDELYEGSIVHGRTEEEAVDPLLNAAISLIPHDMGIVKSIMGKLTADQRRGKLEYALRDHLKTGREFDSFIKSCPLPADEKPASIFVPLSFEDVLNMPPKEWLIDGLFGAGDLGMIFGPPGSGKTFIVIDLILAACLGEPFAMRFNVARPLSVAYCAGEGLAGLPDRFKAAAAHHGVSALPGLTIFRQVPQLYTESQTAANIDQFVLAWLATGKPLDLLMIDTLHSATGGADENSAQHMGVVLESCKLAIKELGCAVLLVHHSNKAGTGERGSSAMRGAMDYMIEVSPTGEQLSGKGKLTCSKLKDGEAWEGQRFSLVAVDGCDSVRVWWDELATSGQGGKKDEVESGVLKFLKQYRGKRFTANDIAEQVAGKDKSDRHLQKVLNSLDESGKIRKDLRNPDKDSSSHNPFVYWYDQQAAAAAEVLSSL